MATDYPPQGQKRSPESAVFGNGFNRILGAGGNETAGRGEKGRDEVLIPPEQRYQTLPWQLEPPRKAMQASSRGILRLFRHGHLFHLVKRR